MKYKMAFTEKNDWLEIILPSGEICLLDLSDLWILEKFKLAKTKGHVSAYRHLEVEHGIAFQKIYLHRLVCRLHPYSSFSVDHINRNGFDNRKNNLRFATRKQNAANSASKKTSEIQYKGVCRRKNNATNPFGAYFLFGKSNSLGAFKTPEEAAFIYDINSLAHHGQFAYLNFPEKKEEYVLKISELGLSSECIYKKTQDGYIVKYGT